MGIQSKILEAFLIKFVLGACLIIIAGVCYFLASPKYQFEGNLRYNLVNGEVESLIQKGPNSTELHWVNIRTHNKFSDELKGV